MYSQAISSKPRTVIKGKMCLSSVKLSIQMPFFSFTVRVYWLPLGSTLLTQFCYKCILRHYLFVYGGFSWCLFSFQDGCLKTNSKTRRNKITFNWFENINRGGDKFLSPLEPSLRADLKLARTLWRLYETICPGNESGKEVFHFRLSKWKLNLGQFGEVSLR